MSVTWGEAGRGAGVLPPCPPHHLCPPTPHLVALQRRPHQDDGPHRGHHVVRGHVLGLGGGESRVLAGLVRGTRHGGTLRFAPAVAALGMGGGRLQAGDTPIPPHGSSRGGPGATHRLLLLLRYVPRGRGGPGGGERRQTRHACYPRAWGGGTGLGWGGLGTRVTPPGGCSMSIALLLVRFGEQEGALRGLESRTGGGKGQLGPPLPWAVVAPEPPQLLPSFFFFGGGTVHSHSRGEARHWPCWHTPCAHGGGQAMRGGGHRLIHPMDHGGGQPHSDPPPGPGGHPRRPVPPQTLTAMLRGGDRLWRRGPEWGGSETPPARGGVSPPALPGSVRAGRVQQASGGGGGGGGRGVPLPS